MKFEWDEAKNRVNVRKHWFDFADAAAVFKGPMVVNADVREDTANSAGPGWDC